MKLLILFSFLSTVALAQNNPCQTSCMQSMKDASKCQALCMDEETSTTTTTKMNKLNLQNEKPIVRDFSCEKICMQDLKEAGKCRALCLTTDPTMETCQREDGDTLACSDGIYRKAADVNGSDIIKAVEQGQKKEKNKNSNAGKQ